MLIANNNYYLEFTDSNLVFDLMPRVTIDAANRVFSIHICKTQGAYEPLFEYHNGYKSFKDLITLLQTTECEYSIVDDYNKRYSLEEFVSIIKSFSNNTRTLCNKYDTNIMISTDGYMFMNKQFM